MERVCGRSREAEPERIRRCSVARVARHHIIDGALNPEKLTAPPDSESRVGKAEEREPLARDEKSLWDLWDLLQVCVEMLGFASEAEIPQTLGLNEPRVIAFDHDAARLEAGDDLLDSLADPHLSPFLNEPTQHICKVTPIPYSPKLFGETAAKRGLNRCTALAQEDQISDLT